MLLHRAGGTWPSRDGEWSSVEHAVGDSAVTWLHQPQPFRNVFTRMQAAFAAHEGRPQPQTCSPGSPPHTALLL